jgi:CubicO group peptidase (beta-lactamase class C family)
MALGIIKDGAEWSGGWGATNVRYPLPVTSDTLFQTGSITKTATVTAVLRLVEQGLLDLDAPVVRYIPELRLSDSDVARRLTLMHLLTHSSGLPDLIEETGRGDDALSAIVEKVAALPLRSPLGESWSYSNVGYSLVGRVIEVVTGNLMRQL